jgi:PAP2 superfamily
MRGNSRSVAGTVLTTSSSPLASGLPSRGRLRPTRRGRVRVALLASIAAAGLTTALAPATAVAPTAGGAAASSTQSRAGVDALLQWNTTAQAVTTTLRPSAHGQTRGTAMVAGAVYDAVNAIDRGHQPYLLDVRSLRIKRWASVDAAIATATHHVLMAISPQADWPALDAAYAATMATVRDGRAEDEGVRAGTAAAAAMTESRSDDGFGDPFVFEIGDQPGDWRPVTPTALDPDPGVGNLRPFLMRSRDQFPSRGPNALTSDEYARDFAEVKEIGSLTSTQRTADQTRAAIFWHVAPAPLWHGMARDLIVRHRLDAADGARLIAMMSLAGADGAIACWNDKYHWNFWRPLAAIREADTDGNPATTADPTWLPLFDVLTPATPSLTNPPFPEHPSGHGCVSGATLHAVKSFFGTDRVAVSMVSGRFPGEPREFSRLSAVLDEIVGARVWSGVHFRTADVDGAVIGAKVGRWMERHYFMEVPRR